MDHTSGSSPGSTPVSTHISSQFDADLEDIRTRMLQMGGMVEAQVRAAVDIYNRMDHAQHNTLKANEERINQLEIDLDNLCTHMIVRRQPAAGDLRLVMAVVKTITDLERIGDEADKIARYSAGMHERGSVHLPGFTDIHTAARIAVTMLKDALDAFARLDATAAARIVLEDKNIDNEFRSVLRQLITFMMEDPRTISTALDTIWIAKAIERVGDHAQNIAEYVIFAAKGTDVRHASQEKLAQSLAG